MDSKKLKESSSVIKKALQEGIIRKPSQGADSFFLERAKHSIQVASRLLELQDSEQLPSSLWVINSSYYAMFFAATALLAKFSHRIDSESGIHRLTYHALVHFFVNEDKKLEKHFIEEYREAVENAEELMQISMKNVDNLLSDYAYEINKRKIFTYEYGMIAERKKAETSLDRARNFVQTVMNMIK
jgi:uncharacterized protein (UPF0332 family)